MRWLPRSFAALTGASISVALAWGCAQSGADGDFLPNDVDPTLPGVDASWDPSPDEPGQKIPEPSSSTSSSSSSSSGSTSSSASSSSGSSSSSSSSSSSGSSGVDAGVDSAPPPPPPPTTPKPTQGEVLITEVMYDPFGTEPVSEWFEVHNVASSARTLSGLTIVDGGNRTHVIGAGVTIASNAYVILARIKSAAITAKVPTASIVYEYGTGLPDNAGIQLANSSTGGVWLRDGATQIAQADYGGWYSQSGGSSVQLKTTTYAASAQSASWCLSLNAWVTGSDKGTPGAASDCP